MATKAGKLKEELDACGMRYYSTFSSKSGIDECDGVCAGNIVGAQNAVGIDNSSTYGTNVHRGIKSGMTKAKKIMKGLKIVEADLNQEKDPDENKVVAQVTQTVTKGDINKASRAAQLLANAGKIDKQTANNITTQLGKIR